MKREPAWKAYPGPLTDSELIRHVTSDATATRLERELALRLDRLMYATDLPSQLEREANGQGRLFS